MDILGPRDRWQDTQIATCSFCWRCLINNHQQQQHWQGDQVEVEVEDEDEWLVNNNANANGRVGRPCDNDDFTTN